MYAADSQPISFREASEPEVLLKLAVSNAPCSPDIPWVDSSWMVTFFYGTTIYSNLLLNSSGFVPREIATKTWSVDAFQELPGEWFAVLHNRYSGDVIVLTDFTGNCTLFYRVNHFRDGLEISFSPSFRAISSRAVFSKLEANLNIDSMVPALMSGTNLFRTRISERTFDNDILILRADCFFQCSADGWNISKRPANNSYLSMDYDQLLEKGIETASNQVQAMLKTGMPVNLALSGGKDSRMLLSIIVSAGLHKEISITTQDRRNYAAGATKDINLEDLRLAAILQEGLGLKWYTAPSQVHEYIDELTSISIWQKFKSNTSFEYVPRGSVMMKGDGAISLLGIGGELIRSYVGQGIKDSFQQWWNIAGGTPRTIAQDLANLFNHLVPRQGLSEEVYNSSQQSFVRAIGGVGQDQGVLSALDSQYAEFRSRAHVGATLASQLNGSFTFYPLCQPAFFAAGRKLPPSELDGGRVIFDVYLKTVPELAALPFASPSWPKSFLSKVSNKKQFWSRYDGSLGLSLFESKQNQNSGVIKYCGVRHGEKERSSFRRRRVIENSIRILDELSGRIPNADLEIIQTAIAINGLKNEVSVRHFLGKTESLLDVLDDSSKSINIWKLEGAGATLEINIETSRLGRVVDVNKVQFFDNLVKEISFDGIDFQLVLVDSLNVELQISELPEDSQAAVYWYINGREVRRDWYCDSKIFNLKIHDDLDVDRVRAMVFLKWDHLREASRIESIELKI